MANAKRGQVSFAALGQTFTLQFTANALCGLETAAGIKAPELPMILAAPSVTMLRYLMQFGLISHHPHITADKAGEVMDEVGFKAAAEAIGRALELAFPSDEPADQGEAQAAANP